MRLAQASRPGSANGLSRSNDRNLSSSAITCSENRFQDRMSRYLKPLGVSWYRLSPTLTIMPFETASAKSSS